VGILSCVCNLTGAIMFIHLTESRKDRETSKRVYKRVLLNLDNVTHIQEPTNNGDHTYIGMVQDKFMFVKETLDEIAKMINK
jgi:hypothetical protein